MQEYDLGTLLRGTYLSPNSSLAIPGLSNAPLFSSIASNVLIQADAGGEGGVIVDSAVALTQGLWPPSASNRITLADGRNVTSPLGGFQYVPGQKRQIQTLFTGY